MLSGPFFDIPQLSTNSDRSQTVHIDGEAVQEMHSKYLFCSRLANCPHKTRQSQQAAVHALLKMLQVYAHWTSGRRPALRARRLGTSSK